MSNKLFEMLFNKGQSPVEENAQPVIEPVYVNMDGSASSTLPMGLPNPADKSTNQFGRNLMLGLGKIGRGAINGLNTGMNGVSNKVKSALLGTQADTTDGLSTNNRVLDYQNYLRGQGLDETTVNGVAQGLNGGNKDISDWINQYNESSDGVANPIRIPQTQDEIDLARQGKFNSLPVQSTISEAPRQGGFLRDVQAGFNENLHTPISLDNFGQGKKSLANRLGEVAGTTMRMVDSPLGRGLLTAGTVALLGGNGAQAVTNGLQATVGNQQYRLNDKLYRDALAQQGVDVSSLPRGYVQEGAYKNLALNTYRTQKLNSQREIASAKDNTTRAKMIINAYEKNMFTEDEAIAELQKYGINVSDLEESNNTRMTNIKENESPHKIANWDESVKYKQFLRNRGGKGGSKGGSNKDTSYYEDLAEFQEILESGDNGKIQYARNNYIKKYGKDPHKLIARDY